MVDFVDIGPAPDRDMPEPDWSKPSLAVIANGDHGGCVLFHVGPHVESLLCEAGLTRLDDLGLDDAPHGISIWEGKLHSWHVCTIDADEWESELRGCFRVPTDAEWAAIREGRCPWIEAAIAPPTSPAGVSGQPSGSTPAASSVTSSSSEVEGSRCGRSGTSPRETRGDFKRACDKLTSALDDAGLSPAGGAVIEVRDAMLAHLEALGIDTDNVKGGE